MGFPDFEAWWAQNKPTDVRWSKRFDEWYAANAPADPAPEPVPTGAPYTPTSPFNQRVDHSKVHPNSAAIIQRITETGWPRQKLAAGIIGKDDWNTAVYHATDSDPLLTITARQYGTAPVGTPLRVPLGAKVPQQGSIGSWDGSCVIVQPDGSEVGLYEGIIDWSGRTIRATGTYLARPDSDGTHLANTCAAEFGLRAGNIDGDELAAGHIPHALIFVVDCTNGTVVEPAWHPNSRTCSSIGNSNTNAPALGQRIFLEETEAGINAVPYEWQRTIMRALRDYGAFVRDTGGGTFKVISHESYKTQGKPDPLFEYAKAHQGQGVALYNGAYYFTWASYSWTSKLRVAA